jgi:hypothetical protein
MRLLACHISPKKENTWKVKIREKIWKLVRILFTSEAIFMVISETFKSLFKLAE